MSQERHGIMDIHCQVSPDCLPSSPELTIIIARSVFVGLGGGDRTIILVPGACFVVTHLVAYAVSDPLDVAAWYTIL